jgi:hypothetical protein
MTPAAGHIMRPSGPAGEHLCTGCTCRVRYWRDYEFPYSHIDVADPGDGSVHHIGWHFFYSKPAAPAGSGAAAPAS